MVDAFAGLPLDDAGPATRAARPLLSDGDWIAALLAPLIGALLDDPLAEPAIRASRDPMRIGAQIHDCPATILSLTVMSAEALAARAPPASVIVPGDGAAIELDELVDALEAAPWNPRDEEALAGFGPLLARLARNPTFLADGAIAELERRGTGTNPGGYGAQALVLRPPNGRYLLRAAFWPALTDAVTRASGAATFFYGPRPRS